MRKTMVIAVAAAAGLTACGEGRAQDAGPNTQRSYQVGEFSSIEVAGPYDVNVRTGAAPSVSASGPERIIDRLVIEVDGDRLRIHPREDGGTIHWNGGLQGRTTISVTAPMLRGAAIAGSGGIAIDKVSGDGFEGSVGGSGDLDLGSVAVRALKLSIGGSGDVRAQSGEARRADYSISGSGDIDAGGIRADTARLAITGSGSINGQATGAAEVSIVGSGDAELTGGAKCTVSRVGSGDVRCS